MMTGKTFSLKKDFKLTFNLSQATLNKQILRRITRWLLESATISHSNHTIKQRPGYTIARYGYVWKVHRMSIKIEHRNLEIRKTRHDFSVQVRNFLLPLSLKVLRHKERDTHSFYSGFLICPPPTPTRVAPATKATGLASASKWKPTVFSRGSSQLN